MSQVQNSPDVAVIVLHCVSLFWGAVHGIGKASRFWVRKSLSSKFPSWCVDFLSSFVDIWSVPYPVFRFTGKMMFCSCAGILEKNLLWWICQDPKMHYMENTWTEFLKTGRCSHTKPSARHWSSLPDPELCCWRENKRENLVLSWNQFTLARTTVLDIQIYQTPFTKWFFFLLVVNPYQLLCT